MLGSAGLWVPAGYALATLAFSRPLRVFESSPDEGFNLAKAALVADGQQLYEDVWSDQPPLFTLLLRATFGLFGESVLVGRLLVLAMACLLLWALSRTARRAFGPGAAWAAPLLLLLVPTFQPLSVALLIGLPALAFATLSLACAAEAHARGSTRWSLASGALLALGALTKLFVLPLVPVVLLATALGVPREARGRCAGAWLLGFAAVLLVGGLALVGPAGLEQLVGPHLDAARASAYRDDPATSLAMHLGPWTWIALLALAGGALAWRRRPTVLPLAMAAWMGTALAVLAPHRPVWDHHMLLWTVPAAMLASPAIVALAAGLWRAASHPPWRRLARPALAVGASVVVAWLICDAGVWRLRRRESTTTRHLYELVARVRGLALADDEMLTDRPMIAFRAGVPVLAQAAVLSHKRLTTGRLTEPLLADLVEARRPAFVLLARFPLPELRRRLAARYQTVYRDDVATLYLRAGTREEPWPCAWPHCLDEADEWYRGPQGRALAENVLRAQHADGGWAKSEDRSRGTARGDVAPCSVTRLRSCSTIDEQATTAELRLLARAHAATGDARLAAAFARGLDHLLVSQTPRGGWPQVPMAPAGTYWAAITLNDGAMAHVLELLDDVARDPAYGFVDPEPRQRAREAFQRGVGCLLEAQVRRAGSATVWCAQYDPLTLAPVTARAYEPAALSGRESVGAVRVLLRVGDPSSEVVRAVEAAASWFESARLPAPDGAPPRWARFYDLATGRPIFPARDGTTHATYEALSEADRRRYEHFTDEPEALLEHDLPRWRARLGARR